MTDPGFHKRGPNPQVGLVNLIFHYFFQNLQVNEGARFLDLSLLKAGSHSTGIINSKRNFSSVVQRLSV